MAQDSESEYVLPAESKIRTKKQILREFIYNFEALPELWDSSDTSYSDKIKRAAAHRKLLQVFQKIQPTATVDDVRKKINSLRSNYRKELRRMVNSKHSGAGVDVVYTPKSWTFHALKFLEETEKPINVGGIAEYESDWIEIKGRSRSLQELDESSCSSVNAIIAPEKKSKVGYMAKQNELIEEPSSLIPEKPQPTPCSINVTAIYWSEKLEKLQPKQRIFAEKAINDILFEAELGTLNRNSVQINQHSTSAVISSESNDAHSKK